MSTKSILVVFALCIFISLFGFSQKATQAQDDFDSNCPENVAVFFHTVRKEQLYEYSFLNWDKAGKIFYEDGSIAMSTLGENLEDGTSSRFTIEVMYDPTVTEDLSRYHYQQHRSDDFAVFDVYDPQIVTEGMVGRIDYTNSNANCQYWKGQNAEGMMVEGQGDLPDNFQGYVLTIDTSRVMWTFVEGDDLYINLGSDELTELAYRCWEAETNIPFLNEGDIELRTESSNWVLYNSGNGFTFCLLEGDSFQRLNDSNVYFVPHTTDGMAAFQFTSNVTITQ